MHYSTILTALVSFAKLVAAEDSDPTYPYFEAPGALPTGQPAAACAAQYTTCFTLCNHQVSSNNCDPTTLDWSCTCSNGPTPNITEYKDTVPAFQCQQYIALCVQATDNADAQHKCEKTPCPSKNPDLIAAAQSSSSAAAAASMQSASSTPASTTTKSSSGGSSKKGSSKSGGSGGGNGANANFAIPGAMIICALAAGLIGVLQIVL